MRNGTHVFRRYFRLKQEIDALSLWLDIEFTNSEPHERLVI